MKKPVKEKISKNILTTNIENDQTLIKVTLSKY